MRSGLDLRLKGRQVPCGLWLLRPCTDIPLAPEMSANERPHRHAMMSQQQHAIQDAETVDKRVRTIRPDLVGDADTNVCSALHDIKHKEV